MWDMYAPFLNPIPKQAPYVACIEVVSSEAASMIYAHEPEMYAIK